MLAQIAKRDMQSYLSTKQKGISPDQRAKSFRGKILRVEVSGAVRYSTERVLGGVLMPTDKDEKTGD